MHHILFYEYEGEDIVERRRPYREEHLAMVFGERDAGRIVLAGALGDPPHSAAIVFRDTEPGAIEAFAQADPYVQNGLVGSWRIEPWNIV